MTSRRRQWRSAFGAITQRRSDGTACLDDGGVERRDGGSRGLVGGEGQRHQLCQLRRTDAAKEGRRHVAEVGAPGEDALAVGTRFGVVANRRKERMAPREELPEDDAGGEGVGCGCRHVAPQMLRREEAGRPDVAGGGVAVPGGRLVGEDGVVHVDEKGTEEQGVAVAYANHLDIGGFEIAVDDSRRVEAFEGGREDGGDHEPLVAGEGAAPVAVEDEVAEVAVARDERVGLEDAGVARLASIVCERGAEDVGGPHALLREDGVRAKAAVELDGVAQIGVVPGLERGRRSVGLEEDLAALLVGRAKGVGERPLVEELVDFVAVQRAPDAVAGSWNDGHFSG